MKAIEMAIRHNINGAGSLKPLWDAKRFTDAKNAALEKLVVLRNLYITVAAEEIDDLSVLTAVRANQEGWGQDAADLTADAFSAVLAANEQVNDDQAIVFYGFVDNTTVNVPDLQSIKFLNGTATIDVWQTEHCAFAPDSHPAGMSENLVVYAPKDRIDIQMNFKVSTVDKNVVLLNVIVEPQTNFIQPKA